MNHFTRALTVFAITALAAGSLSAPLPNILWITSEDNGPQLGCYGDTYATTPNLDALAAKGLLYLNVWSTAPVCAPARTAIISGVYPTALGAQHMRSQAALPNGMRMYPQLLRDLGYYCTNNSKKDYNLTEPGRVWDESSPRAHWKNRKPGQPFFAIFNHTVSHESQIRKRPHHLVHDPARVRVPAYHPDTPEVRLDWAQYYDKITEMDALVGRNLRELAEAGLSEDTIVFYYGDHGAGMPRSKRWPYNSGLHAPLIVYLPEKFRGLAPSDYGPGRRTERLVGFVDLAPTLLSLAGMAAPEWMQGKAFLGPHAAPPQDFLFGFRGRMDERYDLVRSVRDQRFVYIRNYMPHKIYGQFVSYMFETPTTRVWKQRHDQGLLKPPQSLFWQTKPAEELYDLQSDPDETHNLAQSPDHREILQRLRHAQSSWIHDIRDLGFLPEDEIHSRSANSTPYETGRDPDRYAITNVIRIAELASKGGSTVEPDLRSALTNSDSAVRYWAAMGLIIRGNAAVTAAAEDLRRIMANDASPSVRVLAAEALAKFGAVSDLTHSMRVLVDHGSAVRHSVYVAMLALNAIDDLDAKAKPWEVQIRALPADGNKDGNARTTGYVPRLLEKILDDLERVGR